MAGIEASSVAAIHDLGIVKVNGRWLKARIRRAMERAEPVRDHLDVEHTRRRTGRNGALASCFIRLVSDHGRNNPMDGLVNIILGCRDTQAEADG